MKGIEYLRSKLKRHEERVKLRYKQYDMKYQDSAIGITIPPDIRNRYRSVLGWWPLLCNVVDCDNNLPVVSCCNSLPVVFEVA